MFSKSTVICPLLIVIAGCAMHRPVATIPYGEWAGEGWYVAEGWDKLGSVATTQDSANPSARHGRYPTTLAIRPLRVDEHDLIEIRILSEHANDQNLDKDESIRLTALLEAGSRIEESCVLYRLVKFDVGPGAREWPLPAYGNPIGFGATCTLNGAERVLIINYGEEYIDTFRFNGRELEKVGSYRSENGGKVTMFHWVERLSRHRR